MATQNKTDIGLIGLAVMGENLALNMESRGWSVSVYNRTVPGVEEGVVERFMNGRAKDKHIEGFTDIKDFVNSIAVPRKIMMMVRAGSPVDELMEQLFPYLSPVFLSVYPKKKYSTKTSCRNLGKSENTFANRSFSITILSSHTINSVELVCSAK